MEESDSNVTDLFKDLYEAAVRATGVPPKMLADDENAARHLNHMLDAIKACATKEERSE